MKFTGAFKEAIAAAGIGTVIAKSISEGAKLEQSMAAWRRCSGRRMPRP